MRLPSPHHALTACSLFLLAAIQLLQPLNHQDTDLWFHLAGGRYFFDNLELFRTSYFSFIEPVRDWLPYSWVFQVGVYLVHALGGEAGLVLLRCLLYVVTCRALFGLFQDPAPGNAGRNAGLLGGVLALICCLALLQRELNLRPHMVSYLCLAWTLWVLETRPRWRWTLPLAMLVMANAHGIEYPVFVGVLGGYLMRDVIAWLRQRKSVSARAALRPILWLLAAMAAILITPHGIALLGTPFTGALLQDRIINEAMPFRLLNHTFLSFYPPRNLLLTAKTLILAAWVLVLLANLARRQLDVAHLAHAAVALVLLSRHDRFVAEAIILAAPTLRQAAVDVTNWFNGLEARAGAILPPRATAYIVAAVLLIASAACVNYVHPLPRWPLSDSRLPAASARYLMAHGPGGNILSHADLNGYLRWQLWPKYQIFVDMEMSLFTAADLFTAKKAFQSPHVLQRLRERYGLDYILYPMDHRASAFLSQIRDYVPVYVDETGVLCVDASRHTEFASADAIRHFDPFQIASYNPAQRGHNATAAKQELEALLELAGENLLLRRAAGLAALHTGATYAAGQHAETLRDAFPERHHGPELEGLIAFKAGELEEAASHLQEAHALAPESQQPRIAQYLYALRTRQQDAEAAWALVSEALNPYGDTVTPAELYELATAAANAGRTTLALEFLEMAAVLVDPKDTRMRQGIMQKQETLRSKLEQAAQ